MEKAKSQYLAKFKICKKHFQHFIDNTTAHGFSHASSTKYTLIRLVWIIFILTSIGSCCYFIIKHLLQYLDYGVTTKIDTLQDIPSYFPMVTICNIQPFTTKSGEEFINKTLAENNLNSASDINYFTDYQLKTLFVNYLTVINADSNEISNTERQTFGATKEQFILSCSFNLLQCEDKLEWIFHPLYGNCYQFNSGKNSTNFSSSKSGPINGLSLSLFTGPEVEIETTRSDGAIIIITDQRANTASISGSFTNLK
jgi:hypothetical protein